MRRAVPMLALAALPLVVACDPRPQVTVRNAPKDPPALTVADFRKLRWIEGSWRGSVSGEGPFFERSRFADDSTLVADTFADSTLATVTESARYELRGGRLGNANPTARWRASRLDERSVLFVPEVGVRNTFVWRYESPDLWTALLEWPANDTHPAGRAAYRMERIRPL